MRRFTRRDSGLGNIIYLGDGISIDQDMNNNNLAYAFGEAIDRLAELENQIERGELVPMPKKCYQVIWVLGWEIIEYDIVSITYDYDKATITKVIAVRPHSQQVFTNRDLGHFNGIDTDVFFTIAEAEKKLEELRRLK